METTQKEKLTVMVRDNDLFSNHLPTVLDFLARKYDVKTKVFDKDTPYTQIGKYIMENSEKLREGTVFSDGTCRSNSVFQFLLETARGTGSKDLSQGAITEARVESEKYYFSSFANLSFDIATGKIIVEKDKPYLCVDDLMRLSFDVEYKGSPHSLGDIIVASNLGVKKAIIFPENLSDHATGYSTEIDTLVEKARGEGAVVRGNSEISEKIAQYLKTDLSRVGIEARISEGLGSIDSPVKDSESMVFYDRHNRKVEQYMRAIPEFSEVRKRYVPLPVESAMEHLRDNCPAIKIEKGLTRCLEALLEE